MNARFWIKGITDALNTMETEIESLPGLDDMWYGIRRQSKANEQDAYVQLYNLWKVLIDRSNACLEAVRDPYICKAVHFHDLEEPYIRIVLLLQGLAMYKVCMEGFQNPNESDHVNIMINHIEESVIMTNHIRESFCEHFKPVLQRNQRAMEMFISADAEQQN